MSVNVHYQQKRFDEQAREIDQLTRENTTLRQRCEALERDKARLDWLEAQEMRNMVENKNVTKYLIWYPWSYTCWGESYREAIDQAMLSPQPPTGEPAPGERKDL